MAKPDWADDVAKGLDSEAANFRRPEETRANVAAALRKAKADGMREAAELAERQENEADEKYNTMNEHEDDDYEYWYGVASGAELAKEAILTRAAAIEAGEA